MRTLNEREQAEARWLLAVVPSATAPIYPSAGKVAPALCQLDAQSISYVRPQ